MPILGDIPFIGRLFQTKAENRIKSNLIIFVTAQIIDATGRPLGRTGAGGGIQQHRSRSAAAMPGVDVLPPTAELSAVAQRIDSRRAGGQIPPPVFRSSA